MPPMPPPMPPMPPPPPGMPPLSFSLISATIASVVSIRPAIDAALMSAVLVDLGRVDDAGLDHVLELAGAGVEADVAGRLEQLTDDDRTLFARVLGDLTGRLLERATDDLDADRDVALGLDLVDRRDGADERHAAAGDDALFDCRLGGVHGIFDAGLLLLHLGLGGRADLDDGDAADQLREPLLQLLAIVVGGRLLDLGADLLDPAARSSHDASCRRCR